MIDEITDLIIGFVKVLFLGILLSISSALCLFIFIFVITKLGGIL